MLTQRQKELLDLLEHQVDFQTVDFFARRLGVSKRTVHSEIKAVETQLKRFGKVLEKKRGVGILLQKLGDEANQSLPKKEDYSTSARRIELMKLLLFDEATVSFNSLSERFMVSKTSIKNDLEFVMKILGEDNEVELTSDSHGTKLCGSEEALQKAFLQFNRYLSNHEDTLESNLDKKMALFVPYYGEAVVTVCSNILYTYVRGNVNAISEYYVQNVLNIFTILVYRLLQGHHISEKQPLEPSDDSLFFEESAVQMLHKAALRLQLSYTNEDVHYLSQHLIANRFEAFPQSKVDKVIVNGLLQQVSDALTINFSEDEKLEQQLINHIPPMIYRLKNHNKTENPFTTQIKNEFSLTFNVIWVVLSEYEEELGISFNEDEIAFLTMYFQAAIERAKMNRKILVVCQMGIATSELLIIRLKHVLPSLDTLEVASLAELDGMDLSPFDLLISTVKIKVKDKPVIFVSPFLNEEDIEKIKQSGWDTSKEQRIKTLSEGRYLSRFIRPNFLYLDTNFSAKEELIQQIGADLLRNDLVTQEFIESTINREALGGTDLPSGTAVPHGNSLYVNQTVIVIVKNRKKFKWNKYYVDVIFMICIAKEDTKQTRNILADIYNIVDSPHRLEEIRKATSKEKLFKEIGSE